MIICAAIKDTRTGAVFGGIRHGNIYSAMHDAGITPPKGAAIEGFLDEKNNFYNRYEAYNYKQKLQLQPYCYDQWPIERYYSSA